MTPDEEQHEILIKVLGALFPSAPFDITVLTNRIIQGLAQMGWYLAYDEEITKNQIQQVIDAVRAQHPTPTQFVPPQPPERLAGP